MCALVTGVQTCALPICVLHAGRAQHLERVHEHHAPAQGLQRRRAIGVEPARHRPRRRHRRRCLGHRWPGRGSVHAAPPEGTSIILRPDGGNLCTAVGLRAAPEVRPPCPPTPPPTTPEPSSSEEHTSELPSLMRISYAVFCLKKKKI